MSQKLEDEILSLKELAQFLKVSTITARRWCRSGKVPAIKIGNRYRIRKEDIYELFNKDETRDKSIPEL